MTTIYTRKRRFGKYNGPVSVDRANDARDAAHILRRNAPELTREAHQRRATAYRAAFAKLKARMHSMDVEADLLALHRIANRCQDRASAHAWAAQWLTPRARKES